MFSTTVAQCRPIHCACSYRRTLREPIEIAYVLLAVLMSVVLVGCAALGPRLDGVSGPIAWEATDLRVVERNVAGANRDLYAFTLVLKATQSTAITFTQAKYTISQPGINAAGVSEQQTILWKLRPHGELRQPISFYWYCTEFDCARVALRPAPWYDLVLTGTDDRGHPVRVVIDLRLPQNPPRPKTAPTVEHRAVPIQVVNNLILVNAVLNNKEYVTLLLDTGATHTILTPDTAKRLRINPPSEAPKHKMVVTGGQEVTFSFTQLTTLMVGETLVEDLQVGVALVLPEAPLVDGVLGGDVLHRFTMTLNYATSRLQLQPTETSLTLQPHVTAVSAAQRSTVPLQIVDNRPWVHVVLNHQEEVTFLLDTGASRTLLHPSVAKRIGLSLTANAPQDTTTVFGGRLITFPLAQLSSIAVGNAAVEDLQIGVFHALPRVPTANGILGGDFLHHFTMTLDYASSQLWLASEEAIQR
jgi:predicted aspartyl protease